MTVSIQTSPGYAVTPDAAESVLASETATGPTTGSAGGLATNTTKPTKAIQRIGLLVGLTALGVGGARLAQKEIATSWEQTWGTFQTPKFSPDETVRLNPIPTFRQNVHGLRESLITNIKNLRATEEALDTLEGKKLDRAEHALALAAIQRNLFGAPGKSSESQPAGQRLPECSPVEYANKLAERALGKSLPKEMKIVLGGVGIDGMSGFANSLNSKITVDPSQVFPSEWTNYFETVGTIAHEIGHLIFRYAEERYAGWTPWQGASREVSVREEAVAVIFRVLVAAQEDDSAKRWVLAGDPQAHAERHYNGQVDYGLNEGAALADAALTLYPDPYLAFKALTVPGALDPALQEVIARNREAQQELNVLTQEYSYLLQKLYLRMEGPPQIQGRLTQTSDTKKP